MAFSLLLLSSYLFIQQANHVLTTCPLSNLRPTACSRTTEEITPPLHDMAGRQAWSECPLYKSSFTNQKSKSEDIIVWGKCSCHVLAIIVQVAGTLYVCSDMHFKGSIIRTGRVSSRIDSNIRLIKNGFKSLPP